jgi:hypothetical protein
VKAWELKLSFNKNIVNAKQVRESNFFKITPLTPTFFNAGIINNNTGEITNIYNLIVGPGNVSWSRTVINITFKAVSYGRCNINITRLGATNETMYIPANIVNASIFVYSIYDMNADKTMSITDLLDVATYYGQTGAPGWIKEDIDKNGKIQILDLVLISTHWGNY